MLVKRKQTNKKTKPKKNPPKKKKKQHPTSTTWEKSALSAMSGEVSSLLHWRDMHTQTQEFKVTAQIPLAKGAFCREAS